MPIFEYTCENCGKDFEVLVLASDSEVKTCKFCQGPIRKKMSVTTFHLKGTGWYVTDYGGKKAPPCETEKTETKETPATPPETKGSESST
ncbi:MAG: zinc ribbon domain-containing protein [Syntrophaceae bacterium]|jgi:putative FmdB family regulatory protein